MTVLPSFRRSASSPTKGGLTLSIISADLKSSSCDTKVAPAAAYCSSRNCASAPALRSTKTCPKPFLRSKAAFCGVKATLRSLGNISRGTPTIRDEYGMPEPSKGGFSDIVLEILGLAWKQRWPTYYKRIESIH